MPTWPQILPLSEYVALIHTTTFWASLSFSAKWRQRHLLCRLSWGKRTHQGRSIQCLSAAWWCSTWSPWLILTFLIWSCWGLSVSAPWHQTAEAVLRTPFLLNEWRQILTAGARQRNMCQAPEASFQKSLWRREESGWRALRVGQHETHCHQLPFPEYLRPHPFCLIPPSSRADMSQNREMYKAAFPNRKRDSRLHE